MLEFTEYRVPPDVAGSIVPVPIGKELKTQQVAVGVASAQSASFSNDARLIAGLSSVDCRVAFGPNPTAQNGTTKTRLLKANVEYTFWVAGGERLAVIQV